MKPSQIVALHVKKNLHLKKYKTQGIRKWVKTQKISLNISDN